MPHMQRSKSRVKIKPEKFNTQSEYQENVATYAQSSRSVSKGEPAAFMLTSSRFHRRGFVTETSQCIITHGMKGMPPHVQQHLRLFLIV